MSCGCPPTTVRLRAGLLAGVAPSRTMPGALAQMFSYVGMLSRHIITPLRPPWHARNFLPGVAWRADGMLHSIHSTQSRDTVVRHCTSPLHLYCMRTSIESSLALHPDVLRQWSEQMRMRRRTSEGSPARQPQGERGPHSRPLSAVPLRESMDQYPSRLLSAPAMQVTLAASCLCNHCP